ncbi:acyltransferase family protein, partial [bacterium]|nr:acyltransferase family protein [bacterium]
MVAKRNKSLDVLKGIGILAVILGHAIQRVDSDYIYNELFKLIYSFHMPFFVFISGVLLFKTKDKPLKLSFLKSKFERLVIPFILWIFIEYFMSSFEFTGLRFHDYNAGLSSFVIDTFLHPGGLWFLWVLFLCYIIFFAGKYLERLIGKIVWIPIVILSLAFTPIHILGLSRIGRLFIFLILGYSVAHYSKQILLLSNKRTVIIAVFSLLTFLMFSSHYPFVDGWPAKFIYRNAEQIWMINRINMMIIKILTAVAGIIFFSIFSFYVLKLKHFSDVIARIGVISLELYVCHRMFLGVNMGLTGYQGVVSVFIFGL